MRLDEPCSSRPVAPRRKAVLRESCPRIKESSVPLGEVCLVFWCANVPCTEQRLPARRLHGRRACSLVQRRATNRDAQRTPKKPKDARNGTQHREEAVGLGGPSDDLAATVLEYDGYTATAGICRGPTLDCRTRGFAPPGLHCSLRLSKRLPGSRHHSCGRDHRVVPQFHRQRRHWQRPERSGVLREANIA